MIEPDDHASNIIAEQEAASGLRGLWESNWEQIAIRVLPQYARQFTGQNRSMQTPGAQHTEEMVDCTGALALTRFAAAMESMLTPRNSIWHSLIPSDKLLMKDRETRVWFEDATRILFQTRYAPTANYASQKHEDYMMLGAFGTGTIFIDQLQSRYRERGIRYRAVHLGQNYFKENHQGIIDTNFRKFFLFAYQAVDQFGAENLPAIIGEQNKNPRSRMKEHWFIHAVKPRANYDPMRKDYAGMPFESSYVSVTGKATIEQGGYHTFPYAISRYVTAPGDMYGRSPAMMALPSLKCLNEMKKTMLKQGHRVTDPVLLAHDDGILDSFSLRPGAINPGGVNADGKPLVHPLATGNLAAGDKMMEGEKAAINDFFLVTLFQILIETPQMTATEVIERAREKGALLSPTMGRQQSESLGPQIERELDLLVQMKLLPPMPPALLEAQGQYTIQYDSPLSRMSRAEEAAGFMRVVDYAKEIFSVTQDPSLMDNFNFDVALPELADTQAVPVRWMRSAQEIAQVRQGRQEQMQTQQAISAAPAAANVLKTLMPQQKALPAPAGR